VKATLVLGLGNTLLGDEGIGVHAVQRLRARYCFPETTQVLDGGTLGLDLLPYVEDADCLVVIDAVQMDAEPGTVVRLEGEEVPAFLSVKVSPHQMGLPDILAAAKLRGRYPSDIVLWGVQPGVIDTTLELSAPVASQVDALVEGVLADLAGWGVKPTRRDEHGKE
jgi:hydrogenase maturation protease